MELTVEQPCPGCGAPITLGEDHHLIRCDFCGGRNYRQRTTLPRYVLPARLPSNIDPRDVLYVPYLRFKGSVYYCQGKVVRHRILDTTRLGTPIPGLPVSLGLRPQAMPLQPVTAELPGTFARQTAKPARMLVEAGKLASLFAKDRRNPVVHRAFIGETLSRVYLPTYFHGGQVYDGITHDRLAEVQPDEQRMTGIVPFNSSWLPRFLATSCPQCGDGLEGSGNTLVLRCHNCETLWAEQDGRFIQIAWRQIQSSAPRDALYLPFWKLQVECRGTQLATFADLLALLNHPVLIRPEYHERPLAFLVPAFKLNPHMFLLAAKNITVSQLKFASAAESRNPALLSYPVNLPLSEAVQALKSVLAAAAVSPRRVMEILPGLTFATTAAEVMYLPFSEGGFDCIQEQSGVCISRAALHYGRQL